MYAAPAAGMAGTISHEPYRNLVEKSGRERLVKCLCCNLVYAHDLTETTWRWWESKVTNYDSDLRKDVVNYQCLELAHSIVVVV